MENEIIENEEVAAVEDEEVEITEPETVDTSAEEDLGGEGESSGEDAGEPEVNPISELIGSIENKDFVAANNMFNSMLGDRLQAAIEAEKVAVADRLYNPQAPEVEAEAETDGEEVVAA